MPLGKNASGVYDTTMQMLIENGSWDQFTVPPGEVSLFCWLTPRDSTVSIVTRLDNLNAKREGCETGSSSIRATERVRTER